MQHVGFIDEEDAFAGEVFDVASDGQEDVARSGTVGDAEGVAGDDGRSCAVRG